MKKIIITLILFSILSQINAHQLVLRTNLFSHLRPNPTINLNIGLLAGQNKSIEYYLSLEKAYASFDNVVRGVFKPDNSKLNLEYGLGFKIFNKSPSSKKISLYLFGESEIAKLYYKLSTANKTVVFKDILTPYYVPDGYETNKIYNFSRIQFIVGFGTQIKISKKIGLNISLAKWYSYHYSINIREEKAVFIGESIKKKVAEHERKTIFTY